MSDASGKDGGADGGAAGGDKGKAAEAAKAPAQAGPGLLHGNGDEGGGDDTGAEGSSEFKSGEGTNEDSKSGKAYRPKGLPDHLVGETDQETIDKLNKAYKGLRNAGKEEAPQSADEYKLEVPKELEGKIKLNFTDADNAALNLLKPVAHKYGLSQKTFNGMVLDLMQSLKANPIPGVERAEYDHEAEMQLLGGESKAKQVIKTAQAWAHQLTETGILSKEEREELLVMGGTAMGLKVLMKLRALTGEQNIPIVPQAQAGSMSKEDLDKMVGDPRYGKDKAFTEQVTRAYEEMYGRDAHSGPVLTTS